jgi:hypothetical protein
VQREALPGYPAERLSRQFGRARNSGITLVLIG